MSCCDTGRCIEEKPESEPVEAPECPMCDDAGVFYSINFGQTFPCPCKMKEQKVK